MPYKHYQHQLKRGAILTTVIHSSESALDHLFSMHYLHDFIEAIFTDVLFDQLDPVGS